LHPRQVGTRALGAAALLLLGLSLALLTVVPYAPFVILFGMGVARLLPPGVAVVASAAAAVMSAPM
jgi:hypothetical protein